MESLGSNGGVIRKPDGFGMESQDSNNVDAPVKKKLKKEKKDKKDKKNKKKKSKREKKDDDEDIVM